MVGDGRTRVIFVSNPTFVELWLSWGFDNFLIYEFEMHAFVRVAYFVHGNYLGKQSVSLFQVMAPILVKKF